MQIIAAVLLVQPFGGQIISVAIGQDSIPGFRTLLGLTIISVGCLIASYGATQKQEEVINQILEEEMTYEQELGQKKEFSKG